MNDVSANDIRIAAAVGTTRPGNYTSKALALVLDEVQKHPDCQSGAIALDVFNPADAPLPPPGLDIPGSATQELQEMVRHATGVILATPEYHGSFASTMKLIIENLGFPSVLAGKPVALLGVAAGQIGAIKSLEQLRSVCSHIGAIVLPGPVSVAQVREVFDDEGRCLDEAIEQRIRGVATNLISYIQQNICPRVALEAMVRAESA